MRGKSSPEIVAYLRRVGRMTLSRIGLRVRAFAELADGRAWASRHWKHQRTEHAPDWSRRPQHSLTSAGFLLLTLLRWNLGRSGEHDRGSLMEEVEVRSRALVAVIVSSMFGIKVRSISRHDQVSSLMEQAHSLGYKSLTLDDRTWKNMDANPDL